MSDYEQEMQEFDKMNDGIKDMDWHKAQLEAARNGQTAALDLVKAKQKEAAQYKATADHYIAKLEEQEDITNIAWAIIALLVVVVIPVSFLLGGWLLG